MAQPQDPQPVVGNLPAKGKAGVCVNEGPDFRIEVQDVDIPEPSACEFCSIVEGVTDYSSQRMVNSSFD